MKQLQNKKTGEIGCLVSSFEKTPEKITVVEYIDEKRGSKVWYYDSLSKLNDEWEDYEEPKGTWTIDPMNENYIDDGKYTAPDELERYEELGLKFDTEEDAEKAVEKLKAWQRLKDKGFKFRYIENNHIEFDSGYIDDVDQFTNDMALLFGGEE